MLAYSGKKGTDVMLHSGLPAKVLLTSLEIVIAVPHDVCSSDFIQNKMGQKQDNYYISLALYFYFLTEPESFLALMQPNEEQRRHIICEIDACFIILVRL